MEDRRQIMQTHRLRLTLLTTTVMLLLTAALLGCTRDRPVANQEATWTQTPSAGKQQIAPNTTPVTGTVGEQGGVISATPAPGGGVVAPPIGQVPPAIATIPAPADTWSYVVKDGDTLTDIAQRFGADVNVLVTLNNLKDAGDIRAGQVIKIPGKQPADIATQPYGTYTVQRGETLGSIAARYDTTVAELMRINGISNPNLIHPGQVIKVPGSAGDGSSSGGSSGGGDTIYVVRRGDTLSQIAARYGVTSAAIAQANGIRDASKIYEGQRLVIPAH